MESLTDHLGRHSVVRHRGGGFVRLVRGKPEQSPPSRAANIACLTFEGQDWGVTTSTDLPKTGKSDAALRKFERLVDIPMMVLSVLFLVVLVLPVLDTYLSHGWRDVIAVADIAIWIVFAAEYLIRLVLAPYKLRFIWKNPLDLIIVAVPVLRPLRLARLARLARVGALAGVVSRRSRGRLHVEVAVQVVLVAAIIVFVGAVGIFDVERNAPGSNIRTFPDALWWAAATVTTVGYGDKFPITGQGRLIGIAVMITGIAVLGVVTASVASWFVDNLQTIEPEEVKSSGEAERLDARLTEVLERLARIEAQLGTSGTDGKRAGTASP
jgi:voltage-gated potassium channel